MAVAGDDAEYDIEVEAWVQAAAAAAAAVARDVGRSSHVVLAPARAAHQSEVAPAVADEAEVEAESATLTAVAVW